MERKRARELKPEQIVQNSLRRLKEHIRRNTTPAHLAVSLALVVCALISLGQVYGLFPFDPVGQLVLSFSALALFVVSMVLPSRKR